MEKYYVTMTDTYLGGWGDSEGKINKVIFECDSYEEAEVVADNAKNRDEMKYVNIVSNKPSYKESKYFVQVKTKETPGVLRSWYKPGFFAEQVA
ncbi:hypothetical protein [Bacillus cereus group sp. BfR-BA-02730]|uniref:hypothetical protein n=1 Tax=unclassified Bacillus cereus group TaxID=2750818 RepID=UPI000A3016B1|nr:hypothetical protein [Bacillus cereus group sp. BfR-BA-02730]MDX5808280.1 hypothetical protein [Bacillus cereus group sp. BfR-BA-02730]SME48661.1 hypothetical protein BACERE00183_04144 [Bacillus cereus]